MKGSELLRQVKVAARAKALRVELVRHRGKGSHVTVYVGDRFTIFKDPKKELGEGLRRKMLRDLGLDELI